MEEETLAHNTREYQTLCTILEEQKFRCFYCSDIIPEDNIVQRSQYEIAAPVICFSDYTINTVTKEYGSYALLMRKKWAKDNGLNPVLYFEEHSLLTRILGEIEYLTHSTASAAEITDAEDSVINRAKNLEKSLCGLFGYIKSYQHGPLASEKIPANYIFYNEREWRYVPHDLEIGDNLELLVSKDDYKKNKDSYNDKAKKHWITFKEEDIAYIIVETELEIENLKKFIVEKTSLKLSLLENKIRSFERLEN